MKSLINKVDLPFSVLITYIIYNLVHKSYGLEEGIVVLCLTAIVISKNYIDNVFNKKIDERLSDEVTVEVDKHLDKLRADLATDIKVLDGKINKISVHYNKGISKITGNKRGLF